MSELSAAAQVLGDALMERGVDARGMTPVELVIVARALESLALVELADEVVVLDILQADRSAKERVEAVCKEGVLPRAVRDAWLEIVIERAIRNHALNCGIPKVERWARKWLSGEDRSAAAAAAAARAARAAVWAAWATARAAGATARAAEAAEAEARAAEAAAKAAAAAAAVWAAWATARAAGATAKAAKAAWAAARAEAAAWAAEYERQIDDLRRLLL